MLKIKAFVPYFKNFCHFLGVFNVPLSTKSRISIYKCYFLRPPLLHFYTPFLPINQSLRPFNNLLIIVHYFCYVKAEKLV
jgi:hypothetical protein